MSSEDLTSVSKKRRIVSTDPIKIYLKEISYESLLTPEEEVKLTTLARKGDKKAKEKVIKSNLRLVVSIAKRYMNYGLSILDLIEEGNLGLIKAIERFRPQKKLRFSTYASCWIKQSIIRALATQSRTIRIPVHVIEMINKYIKITSQFIQKNGREPNILELSKRMKMTADKVKEIIKISERPASLETKINEKDNKELLDLVEDKNTVSPMYEFFNGIRKDKIMSLLDSLSNKEKKILKYRFGLENNVPYTLEQTGKVFGVTRERIRQIEMKALKKLRKFVKMKPDKDVLKDFMSTEE